MLLTSRSYSNSTAFGRYLTTLMVCTVDMFRVEKSKNIMALKQQSFDTGIRFEVVFLIFSSFCSPTPTSSAQIQTYSVALNHYKNLKKKLPKEGENKTK